MDTKVPWKYTTKICPTVKVEVGSFTRTIRACAKQSWERPNSSKKLTANGFTCGFGYDVLSAGYQRSQLRYFYFPKFFWNRCSKYPITDLELEPNKKNFQKKKKSTNRTQYGCNKHFPGVPLNSWRYWNWCYLLLTPILFQIVYTTHLTHTNVLIVLEST
jgi:hypothetical protein